MAQLWNRPRPYLLILCAIALVAYTLPWLTNPGLSFSAYDLAEWVSLHPAVRESALPFLTSLLLRLPLACLGIIIATTIPPKNFGLRLIVVFLISIALLPPLEFFTRYQDDPNYRQQLVLALTTFFTGVHSIWSQERKLFKSLTVLIVLIGALSGLTGLIQGYSLMRQFNVPVQIGIGGIIFLTIIVLIILTFLPYFPSLKQTR